MSSFFRQFFQSVHKNAAYQTFNQLAQQHPYVTKFVKDNAIELAKYTAEESIKMGFEKLAEQEQKRQEQEHAKTFLQNMKTEASTNMGTLVDPLFSPPSLSKGETTSHEIKILDPRRPLRRLE